MIKKFLYQLDARERKVLTAIVEDNEESVYVKDKLFPTQNREAYIANDEEIVTKNNGKLVYVVFKDGEKVNYLDINIFKDEVKISLTSNLSHAACYGEDFMSAILHYVNYFDYEDCEFVFSGMSKNKRGDTDIYEKFFKKANDDSYIKLNKNNKPYFITKSGDFKYELTTDFTKAVKVSKNEIRKMLIITHLVDENTERLDLSFSKFKCIATTNGYIYGGHTYYKMTYIDGILEITTENIVIDLEDRLINSEDIFLKLKDVSYLLDKEKTNKTTIVEANGKFVKELSNQTYQMVENPYHATLIDEANFNILSAAFKAFSSDSKVLRHGLNAYVYITDKNILLSSNPIMEYTNGYVIDKTLMESFYKNFDISFNNRVIEEGVILIKENTFLKLTMNLDKTFDIEYVSSSYNASLFTEKEANIITLILNDNIIKRELKNLVINNNLSIYNLTYSTERTNILENYQNILKSISENKHRLCSFENYSDVKVESEKGSLELLRRFYPKDIWDYKKIFESVFNKKTVKNILIIGSRLNVELEALSLAVKSSINVSYLIDGKTGYLPLIKVNPLITVNGIYKLKLGNLPKSFLSNFDMLVFGPMFNDNKDDFSNTLDEFTKDNNVIITNLRTCKVIDVKDSLHEYLKGKGEVKRKHFNHDMNTLLPFPIVSNKLMQVMHNTVCKCQRPFCIVDDPYIENDMSYHSIVEFKSGKLFDLYRK